MSLNQVVKIPSEQSAFDTSGAKNNVDFVLPAGQVYDLSRSYIALTVEVRNFIASGAEILAKNFLSLSNSIDGVVSDSVKAVHIPSGAVLVKNAHMSSQNNGKISDVRRVDKYAFTKAQYEKTTEDSRNDVGTLNSHIIENSTIAGNVNEYNTYGREVSRNRTHDVRIPLKDILPYCRNSAHDGNKHGDTRLHTEINLDKLKNEIVSLSGQINAPVTAGAGAFRAGQVKINEFKDQTFQAAVPTTGRTMLTKAIYGSKNAMPFYVGEQITIAGNLHFNGGGSEVLPANVARTIVEINRSAGDDIEIILDNVIPSTTAVSNGDEFRDLVVSDLAVDTTKETITINNIELVSEIVQDAPKSGVVTYDTVLSEEDTYTASNSLNRVYDIPPMCKNFYIMFFKGGGVASDDAHLNNYRVTIDNVEQSQANVVIGSPEHIDNIMRVYANGGGELNNVSEKYTTCSGHEAANIAGFRNNMVAYPTPFLNRNQKLQIELNASAGNNLTGRLIVYYDCVRQV